MKIRRDILLFVAVAVAAVAGGWWLLANRPGGNVEAFQDAQRQREVTARGHLPLASAFRATVCADAPCVAIEAGGLTFLFGAGAGSAGGIRSLGLMHPNIDGLLLPDLAIATVEGLPGIAEASGRAGRREALRIYGPAGLVSVVDGANLLAAFGGAARLSPGTEGEDRGAEGRVVFDSGVVAVRGFGGREQGSGRVFRLDFDGRSLVLAGCLSESADIVAAIRGAGAPAGILFAGSEVLLASAGTCQDLPQVARIIRQAKLPAALVVPSAPSAALPGAIPAWTDVLAAEALENTDLGLPGARIDLSGETPRLIAPN